jgi:3-(3-hydroxy-phenyl)propionate hydroxylase
LPWDAAPLFDYDRAPEIGARGTRRVPVIVVGAGPVGLAAAVDLGLRGVPTLLLEEDDRPTAGSRAICWAKRTLEIFDRLGIAERVLAAGITWNRGKVFFRDRQIYAFDLLPEPGHRFPAFVNLQQYYVERFLAERARQVDAVEVRCRNRVADVTPREDGVEVRVATPDGEYRIECDWLIAADGVKGPVRKQLGLESRARVFPERFLITDVIMKAEFPIERWFWFDPPFHRGHSALLHRQADDVWRIDLQLGPDADPGVERQPERVLPRIRAMLGEATPFELEWVSVYTFQCRRLERFRHGRVIFAGDSAHTVSPFGARGGNGGIQDADNLAWKLAYVARGLGGEPLIDSYDAERIPAADENIAHSTRTTDFITPKSEPSRVFRDAALTLAEDHVFARRLVNSGRLSTPTIHRGSPLSTADEDRFDGGVEPGAPAIDAPVVHGGDAGWLLPRLAGDFVGLYFTDGDGLPPALERFSAGRVPYRTLAVRPAGAGDSGAIVDTQGLVAKRYDAAPGTFCLLRPDQHVTARWRSFDPERVRGAIERALSGKAAA